MSAIWLNRNTIINKNTGEEIPVISLLSSYEIPLYDDAGYYDYDLGGDNSTIIKTEFGVKVDPDFDWSIFDWINDEKKNT